MSIPDVETCIPDVETAIHDTETSIQDAETSIQDVEIDTQDTGTSIPDAEIDIQDAETSIPDAGTHIANPAMNILYLGTNFAETGIEAVAATAFGAKKKINRLTKTSYYHFFVLQIFVESSMGGHFAAFATQKPICGQQKDKWVECEVFIIFSGIVFTNTAINYFYRLTTL